MVFLSIVGNNEKSKDLLIESMKSKQTRTDAQLKQLREVGTHHSI